MPTGWDAHLVSGVCRPLTDVGRIRIQNGCRTAVTQGYTPRRLKLRLKRWMSASASTTSGRPVTSTLHPDRVLLVIVIGLERGSILPLGCRDLRPERGAEDHVLAIYHVVHWQDHHLAVRHEADPPHRDGGQQPQALIKWQYLKPCVIGRIPWHSTSP